MNKKLQVFISSTYLDLKIERQAAVEAILKAGHIPAGMELFTAGNQSQMETIKRWIDESDVYMLVLGGRYGSIEPSTSLSYIELEYDYAESKEIPLFSVVIKEDALEAKIKSMGSDAFEKEHPDKLNIFRDKVLNKISSFFADSKDIKLAVHETLADFQNRYKFRGWIPGDEATDVKPFLEEINNLKKDNQKLEDELRNKGVTLSAKTSSKSPMKSQEYDELIQILDKIKVETNLFNEEGQDKPREFKLIDLFYLLRDKLTTGSTNKYNASKFDNFLFFNVFPKLETHSLAKKEKVAGVQWKRYELSSKGLELIAYLDKKKYSTAETEIKKKNSLKCAQ